MVSLSKSKADALVATLNTTKTNAMAQTAWIIFFAGLTALGAQIEIPHQPVPYTMQTFFVLLGGAFLGSRNGSLSQVLYLFGGLAGIPLFAGGSAGSLIFFGASGGYLLSFPIAALIVGYLVHQRSGYLWTLISMFMGLLFIFACGTLFLNFFVLHNFAKSVISGFLIFSWWDLLKLSAAAGIYDVFAKRYRRLPT